MTSSATAGSREVFSQIAGDAALDLVNTVSWRLNPQRRIEHLVHYDDVLRWAEQVGMLDSTSRAHLESAAATDPLVAEDELRRILALREDLYESAYNGGPADLLVREYTQATADGRLEWHDPSWHWSFDDELATPRHRIAIAALELLLHGEVEKLGQCADADCGWVYLDSSPRHNRRWCVAADCGNRNRVRDYYARSRVNPPR